MVIHQGKVFGYFDSVDIAQEVRLLCYRKLDAYRGDRSRVTDYYKGLEHWLNRVVTNGLRNLYRDNMGGAIKHYKNDSEIDVEKRAALAGAVSLEESYYYNADAAVFKGEPEPDDDMRRAAAYVASRLDDHGKIIMAAIGSGCETVGQHYRGRLMEALKVINDELDGGR